MKLDATQREVRAIDAQYAAARYGPWFDRYQRMTAILEGKGLLVPGARLGEGLRATDTGRLAARQLITHDSWARQHQRATFLRKHLNLSARSLDLAIRAALNSAPGRDEPDASAVPVGLPQGPDGADASDL